MNYRVVINGLRILWVAVTLWYELGAFLRSVSSCNWPDVSSQVSLSSNIATAPSHVLLVADPQILDHRSYPERGPLLTYLTRLIVDLNLRKNWWAALRKRPDVVIFLGDMMDGGRIDMPDEEYKGYYQRFKSIFRLPLGIPTYFIPGNHDVGLRASSLFSPYARTRYRSHFGPLNSQISIVGHTLLFLDAQSLIEEDSLRSHSQQTNQEWQPRRDGPIEIVKTIANQPRVEPLILFSHIPLARDSFDCGPLREKGAIRPGAGLGYQNTLAEDTTSFVLESLQPSVIFSGDDHDYCETYHTYQGPSGGISKTREVSVKSMSMAMGIRRPGFQLLSLSPLTPGELPQENQNTLADVPCLLPDQIDIYLSVYIPLLVVSLFATLFFNMLRLRRHVTAKRPRRFSSPSRRLGDDSEDVMALLPQPVSARTDSGLKRRMPSSLSIWSRRRRVLCFAQPCLTSRSRRSLSSESLWGGFFRDCLDIAVFPLGLFAVISLWTTFT